VIIALTFREYIAVLEFDENDQPKKRANSKRSFCGECSSMLWLHDEEWANVSVVMSTTELMEVDLSICFCYRQS
jgi:hypothetical protein